MLKLGHWLSLHLFMNNLYLNSFIQELFYFAIILNNLVFIQLPINLTFKYLLL